MTKKKKKKKKRGTIHRKRPDFLNVLPFGWYKLGIYTNYLKLQVTHNSLFTCIFPGLKTKVF